MYVVFSSSVCFGRVAVSLCHAVVFAFVVIDVGVGRRSRRGDGVAGDGRFM